MLAVLFDLAPKERQKGIVDSVMSEEPLNTQPWFMYWIFQAIDHAGSFERYGTPQLRRWQCLPETHSFREMWTSGDLSHGWCSTPLVEMSSRILGVFPASPGFDTVAIRPQPCDLSWAKGRVPTPHGEVSVEWVINRGTLALDVGVPTGTDAEVTLPVSRFIHPRITLDGREVGDSSRVSSGRYHFEVTGEPR
jgi:hypothetical protein